MGDIVTFGVNGRLYGAPVEALDGVDQLGAITPLPGAPTHVRGLTNRRGYMLPVLDLCALLGEPPRTVDGPLIVTLRVGDLIAAITADDAPNIEPFSPESLSADSASPLLQGTTSSASGPKVTLLHAEALLRAAMVHES